MTVFIEKANNRNGSISNREKYTNEGRTYHIPVISFFAASNHIVMMGRLVRDPELRNAGDTPVCSFRIACDRDFKNKNGEKDTDFVDVVVWRRLAENVAKHFSKGRMAVVSSRLQIRDWTDKDGEKRFSTEIVADNVYFGDAKPKNGDGAATGTSVPGDVPDGFIPNFDEDDRDLPF